MGREKIFTSGAALERPMQVMACDAGTMVNGECDLLKAVKVVWVFRQAIGIALELLILVLACWLIAQHRAFAAKIYNRITTHTVL